MSAVAAAAAIATIAALTGFAAASLTAPLLASYCLSLSHVLRSILVLPLAGARFTPVSVKSVTPASVCTGATQHGRSLGLLPHHRTPAASTPPCRRRAYHRKDFVYMDLSKVIHLVPSPRYEQNTFMVCWMGPRHTGHIGVLVLVSCSAHLAHTHW